MMKKNKVNIFKNTKTSRRIILAMGFIVFFVFLLVLLIFQSNYEQTVEAAKSQGGTYGFCVEGVDDDMIEQVVSHPLVSSYNQIDELDIYENENEYVLYNIDEEDLNLLGLNMIKGEFPDNENEILVDRDYLSSMELDYSIIGKTISLAYNGEVHNYIVSGVLNYEDVFENDEMKSFKFVVSLSEKMGTYTYFSIADYNRLDDDLLAVDESIEESVYPNWKVYFLLGFENDISLYEQNLIMYRYIYVVIMISIMFFMYNMIKVCVEQQFEKIAICNLIGIDRRKLSFQFVKNIIWDYLAGGIMGIIAGVAVITIIHKFVLGNTNLLSSVLLHFDKMYYVGGVLLSIVFILILLIPIIIRLMRLSSAALLQENKHLFMKKENGYKNFLFDKGKSFCRKMARHYLKNDKGMRFFATLGCCFAVCVIVAGLYYKNTNYNRIVNGEYQYCVQLSEEMTDELEEMRENYNHNLGFSSDIKIYPLYEEAMDANISKENLSDSYLKYINQDMEKKYDEITSSTTKLVVSVLGYSDEELKQLYKANGIDENYELADGKALVYRNIQTECKFSKSFYTDFSKGDSIEIDYDDTDKKNVNICIDNSVDTLPIEAEYGAYRVVFIVSEKYFQEITGAEIPQKVYISDTIRDEFNRSVLEQLELSKRYDVTYPMEDHKNIVELNRIITVMVSVVFGITICVSIVIIISNNYMRMTLKRKEYAMMKAIGISDRRIILIFVVEGIVILLDAIIIAWMVSYFITKKMLLIKYPVYGNYLYDYPIKSIFVSSILAILVWFVSVGIVAKEIRTIDMNKELRAIN